MKKLGILCILLILIKCTIIYGRVLLIIYNNKYMLRWSLTFLIIAIIAGLFGFTNIAGLSVSIAKILSFIFLVLFIITLVMGGSMVKGIKDNLPK